MNLIELFDSLTVPDLGNENVFNALPIPGYQFVRLAIDIEGNPVLLLSVTNKLKSIALKNFRLKYLNLTQNLKCRISENGTMTFETFTIISFNCEERHLQEYFLRISESLVKSLNSKPTQEQVIETINRFVEIFRSLTDTPTNTVQGLWSELFLIDNSRQPITLLDYWHNTPEEKFDFNSGEEKIEVKSTSNFERIHYFSSTQLTPPAGSNVLIASIFVRQDNRGLSIQQLIDNIKNKIQDDTSLTEKLNNIVCRTLGSSLEQSIKIKFDYNIAKESLQYFNYRDICKIEEVHIPSEVSDVKYKSDLTSITPTNVGNMSRGNLFRGL